MAKPGDLRHRKRGNDSYFCRIVREKAYGGAKADL